MLRDKKSMILKKKHDLPKKKHKTRKKACSCHKKNRILPELRNMSKKTPTITHEFTEKLAI